MDRLVWNNKFVLATRLSYYIAVFGSVYSWEIHVNLFCDK